MPSLKANELFEAVAGGVIYGIALRHRSELDGIRRGLGGTMHYKGNLANGRERVKSELRKDRTIRKGRPPAPCWRKLETGFSLQLLAELPAVRDADRYSPLAVQIPRRARPVGSSKRLGPPVSQPKEAGSRPPCGRSI
jgi:hypothetical protein